MSSQEQLQSLIRALITNGTLTEVQRSIILSHAELQGISAEETERLIQEALQQPPPIPPADDQSGFITQEPLTPADSPQNISQSNASQANYSGVQFGPGKGFTDVELMSQDDMTQTQKARLDGRWVVVRRLPQAYKYNQAYADALFKEYFNGRNLEHPHIANIYGRGEDADGPFFYMEYVDGQPLSKRITEGGIKDQRFIRKVAVEILDALSYAHKKQLYHRNLKPDTILVTNKGDNVKLIDFGSAVDKLDSPAALANAQKYAAPEQSSALGQVDGRTDLYAFGLVLLEMFTGDASSSGIKQLPLGYWRSIIAQCLQPNPADRFQNAGEILDVINSYHGSVSQPSAQAVTPPAAQTVHTPANPTPPQPTGQPAFSGPGLQKLPNDVAVLVLGIVSIVFCWCGGFILGIIGLVLANQSESAYRLNPTAYDPNSLQLVKGGKICAIIGITISVLSVFGWIGRLFSAAVGF